MMRSETRLLGGLRWRRRCSSHRPLAWRPACLGAQVTLLEPGGATFDTRTVTAGVEWQDGDGSLFDAQFGLVPTEFINISDNLIALNFVRPVSLSLRFDFNPFAVGGTSIQSATVTSTDPAITAGDLMFTANTITIDLNGTAQGLTQINVGTNVPNVIPEPGTWALLVSGLGGLLFWGRRRTA